jgi:hypothetical protein
MKIVNKLVIIFLVTIGIIGIISLVKAQEVKLDYGDQVILDSDLDGLTDLGETAIFMTDPLDPDTDGDGIYDGAEIVGQSKPLDPTSPRVTETLTYISYFVEKETPWAWYLARASALVGFLLLFISIFMGLAIRTPILNRLIKPLYSYSIHCWISLQALIFAALHGTVLLFDKFIHLNLKNIFVPFYLLAADQLAIIDPKFLAMGILAFYIMLLLVASSYLRRFISYWLWRAIHFLNIGLYVIVFLHALYLGTDLKSGTNREVFILANFFLFILFVFNLIFRLIKSLYLKIKQRYIQPPTDGIVMP